MLLTGSLRKQDEEYDVKIYADWWPTWIQLDTAPSEICIILHIIRKPNSMIVLLFIQNMWPWKAKRALTEKPFQLEKRTDIIPVNSKTAYFPHPPSGHWVCLKIFAQIPRYADRLDGQMPHHLVLRKASHQGLFKNVHVKPFIQM